mgnify:FL=1
MIKFFKFIISMFLFLGVWAVACLFVNYYSDVFSLADVMGIGGAAALIGAALQKYIADIK